MQPGASVDGATASAGGGTGSTVSVTATVCTDPVAGGVPSGVAYRADGDGMILYSHDASMVWRKRAKDAS